MAAKSKPNYLSPIQSSTRVVSDLNEDSKSHREYERIRKYLVLNDGELFSKAYKSFGVVNFCLAGQPVSLGMAQVKDLCQ